MNTTNSDYKHAADEATASSLDASALHKIGSYWLDVKADSPVVYKRCGRRGEWTLERHDGLQFLENSRSERERRVFLAFRDSFKEWEQAKRELEGMQ